MEPTVTYTEPAPAGMGRRRRSQARQAGDPASRDQVPLFTQEGEKVKVSTGTGEFGGQA
ncbi:MAG: hypothetical protein IPO28_15545 [Holophagaceae bacterium]|nr:hypothetical protein [Holophagaceae bacterium]